MTSKKMTSIAAVAFAWAGLALSGAHPAQAQQSQQFSTETGITKPSVHSKLGLNQLAVIREIPVKEGQAVKKGDLLLQQDDRPERAELKALELDANSDVEIRAVEADLALKKVQLKRVEELAAKGSSTPIELEKAQVDVVYGQAQVDLAKQKQQTKKYEAEKQGYRVEQMTLLSPLDGFVEDIAVSVGEVTDPQKPFMTVVQLDPLWIEFWLPTSQSMKLKVGQTLDVRYYGEEQWLPAKLILRAPVAEAAAGKQKLRLELKNPNNVDAGQQVQIKLPPELGVTGAAPAAAVVPAP
jgi:RND family efflux transporter MFP subunit